MNYHPCFKSNLFPYVIFQSYSKIQLTHLYFIWAITMILLKYAKPFINSLNYLLEY